MARWNGSTCGRAAPVLRLNSGTNCTVGAISVMTLQPGQIPAYSSNHTTLLGNCAGEPPDRKAGSSARIRPGITAALKPAGAGLGRAGCGRGRGRLLGRLLAHR